MALLFTYLILALSISFLCSILEAVLLSIPISYVEIERRENPKSKIVGIKDQIDKPLSAILSLNTIAHTIGAAGVGAQASIVFGDQSFGLVSAILTMLILVFSEILPKSIGARYWKDMINFTAKTIRFMIWITYPLVILSELFTKIVGPSKKENTVSRDELSALVSIGAEEGVIDSSEQRMIDNFLATRSTKVEQVLTPRVVVVAAPASMTLTEFITHEKFKPYSRIPIYGKTSEDITGYVVKTEVYENLIMGRNDLTLKEIRRDVVYVTNSTLLPALWEKLITKKEHMGIVVDEYGGFEGVVTMEDVLETILGTEIVDERDTIVDMQEYAKEKYGKHLEEVKEEALENKKE